MEVKETDARFDLAVIGAGIYGAALAYEASRRGMKVLLLEKDDIGAAASANSLKVIHGGLRYLQSLDVHRTTYSAAERKVLMQFAPQLVRPMHCLVPLSRSLVKNELTVGLVAMFYNWLTRRRNEDMPGESRIPDAGVASLQAYQQNAVYPLKDAGSFALDWHDAQAADTERLLTLMLKDARRAGAQICNYHTLTDLELRDGAWHLTVFSQRDNTDVCVSAAAVVDCSGAWSATEQILMPEKVRVSKVAYVKAVNLITRKKLGLTAFGFNSRHGDQGRLLFAAPCGEHTLIGTWYYDDNMPDAPDFSRREAELCVSEVNQAFAHPVLSVEDITQVHIGYLPADQRQTGKDDPESWLMRHNRTLSWPEYPGMWVIKGTKYTTARYEAERFLKANQTTLGFRTDPAAGKLSDHAADGVAARSPSSPGVAMSGAPGVAGVENKLAPELLAALKARYERCFPALLEFLARTSLPVDRLAGTSSHLSVEVLYAVRDEWAWHLDDILVRRLGLGSLEKPAKSTIDDCLRILRQYEGWNDARCEMELQRLHTCYPQWLA